MMRWDVTLVTHAGLRTGSQDDRLLAGALASAGVRVRIEAWDDPAVDWSTSAATVVRSTWNYFQDPGAWAAWTARVALSSRLLNTHRLLSWNAHKSYLHKLEAAGVAIAPTILARSYESFLRWRDHSDWRDVVVKPAIGAGAHGARRFIEGAADPAMAAHALRLFEDGDLLIQPYLPMVETARERSLVYFGAALSHAFTKPAFHPGGGLGDAHALWPHAPDVSERRVAEAALAALPETPCYARADLAPTPDGPRLMELELIEPDLGLRLHAGAADRFAQHLLAALQESVLS